jgi:hypothetical protein
MPATVWHHVTYSLKLGYVKPLITAINPKKEILAACSHLVRIPAERQLNGLLLTMTMREVKV